MSFNKTICFVLGVFLFPALGLSAEEECDRFCYLKTYDCLRDSSKRNIQGDCLGKGLNETLKCFDGVGGMPIHLKKQCLNKYDTCLQVCYDSNPN